MLLFLVKVTWVLADVFLKSVILVGMGWLALVLAKRQSAATRHLVLVLTIVGLLILPPISLSRLHVEIQHWPILVTSGKQIETKPTIGSEILVSASIAIVWLAGYLAFVCRLASSVEVIRKLARGATSASIESHGLAGEIAQGLSIGRQIVYLDAGPGVVISPMTWGVSRPVVLLPHEAVEWPVDRLRAVLRHELAHIQRLDWAWQMAAQAAAAIYWYNPLVGQLAKQLLIESETACDDCVLASGVKPSDYAQYLLEVARSLPRHRPTAVTAMAMAHVTQIETRLRAILAVGRSRRELTATLIAFGAFVAVFVVLPLGAVRPRPHRSAEQAGTQHRVQTPNWFWNLIN